MSCKKFRCCYGDQLNSTSCFVLLKLMPTYLFILKGLAFWRKLLAMKLVHTQGPCVLEKTVSYEKNKFTCYGLHAYDDAKTLSKPSFAVTHSISNQPGARQSCISSIRHFLLDTLYIVNGCMYNIRVHTILLKLGCKDAKPSGSSG